MPASSTHRATPSGPKSIFTPSCSSTSADPHIEEAARLPCLATLAPHAEATMAESVEMLKVDSPSPPVPHVSSSAASIEIGVAFARAARAKPVISSEVSPFIRSATRNPAIWTGVASPRMICSKADAASSSVRDSHITNLAIASITAIHLPTCRGRIHLPTCRERIHLPTCGGGGHRLRGPGGGRPPSNASGSRLLLGTPHEVRQDLLAFFRQHRLGMELHS